MMKKYKSLGELLLNYRKHFEITQNELAARLNVDVRTLQRWENNQTLIKPEKEEDVVLETLLPHQLIRNLNTSKPIPAFYDLDLRKYSLTPITNNLYNASWLKGNSENFSEYISPVSDNKYLKYVQKNIALSNNSPKTLKTEILLEAGKLLPQLNIVIKDDLGFYSGHTIVLPINETTFKKLKNQEIAENDIQIRDLVDYKKVEKPIFYNYDTFFDSNKSHFYGAQCFIDFFKDLKSNEYTYCKFAIRSDIDDFINDLGLKLIWTDLKTQQERNLKTPPRFYAGNFKEFLSE